MLKCNGSINQLKNFKADFEDGDSLEYLSKQFRAWALRQKRNAQTAHDIDLIIACAEELISGEIDS
jgi:hypothetical protein